MYMYIHTYKPEFRTAKAKQKQIISNGWLKLSRTKSAFFFVGIPRFTNTFQRLLPNTLLIDIKIFFSHSINPEYLPTCLPAYEYLRRVIIFLFFFFFKNNDNLNFVFTHHFMLGHLAALEILERTKIRNFSQ